jgi:hypothetical protein
MSTTVPSSPTPRSRVRAAREPLTARAKRMRDACVCHAAARLGLPVPTDADLRAMPADARLGEAFEWWRVSVGGDVGVVDVGRRMNVVLRVGVITAVTLIGLALSYGRLG